MAEQPEGVPGAQAVEGLGREAPSPCKGCRTPVNSSLASLGWGSGVQQPPSAHWGHKGTSGVHSRCSKNPSPRASPWTRTAPTCQRAQGCVWSRHSGDLLCSRMARGSAARAGRSANPQFALSVSFEGASTVLKSSRASLPLCGPRGPAEQGFKLRRQEAPCGAPGFACLDSFPAHPNPARWRPAPASLHRCGKRGPET